MIQLVAIGINRRDRHRDPPRFTRQLLDGFVNRLVDVVLPTGVVRAAQVGEHQADVGHLRDGHEQVGQRSRGHRGQVAVAHRHRYGVFQIRRQLIQEDHQRLLAQQLLPRLRARCTQQG